MPNFTNGDGYECPYFKLLAGEMTGIEKRLYSVVSSIPRSAIAIASPFSLLALDSWGKAGVDVQRLKVILRERGIDLNTIDAVDLEGNVLALTIKGRSNPELIPLQEMWGATARPSASGLGLSADRSSSGREMIFPDSWGEDSILFDDVESGWKQWII